MSYISYAYQNFPFVHLSIHPAGSITPTGALTLKFLVAPTGSITPTGAVVIVKNADDVGTLTGSIALAGSITEMIVGLGIGQCEGSIALAGSLVVGISFYTINTDGLLALTGTLNLQTQITPKGSITPVGTLIITDLRIVAGGSITPTGALVGGAPVKLTAGGSGYQDSVFVGILVTVLD